MVSKAKRQNDDVQERVRELVLKEMDGLDLKLAELVQAEVRAHIDARQDEIAAVVASQMRTMITRPFLHSVVRDALQPLFITAIKHALINYDIPDKLSTKLGPLLCASLGIESHEVQIGPYGKAVKRDEDLLKEALRS